MRSIKFYNLLCVIYILSYMPLSSPMQKELDDEQARKEQTIKKIVSMCCSNNERKAAMQRQIDEIVNTMDKVSSVNLLYHIATWTSVETFRKFMSKISNTQCRFLKQNESEIIDDISGLIYHWFRSELPEIVRILLEAGINLNNEKARSSPLEALLNIARIYDITEYLTILDDLIRYGSSLKKIFSTRSQIEDRYNNADNTKKMILVPILEQLYDWEESELAKREAIRARLGDIFPEELAGIIGQYLGPYQLPQYTDEIIAVAAKLGIQLPPRPQTVQAQPEQTIFLNQALEYFASLVPQSVRNLARNIPYISRYLNRLCQWRERTRTRPEETQAIDVPTAATAHLPRRPLTAASAAGLAGAAAGAMHAGSF